MIFICDLITYSYSSHVIKNEMYFVAVNQSHIDENKNNLIIVMH